MVRKPQAISAQRRIRPVQSSLRHRVISAVRAKANGTEKLDVAEIEHRRVNHHARVLQQGIQVVAVGRNRHQPFEGIGQKQNQAEETDNQPALHRDDERQVLWIAPPAVPGDDQGIERQNPRPQVERAFMTAPERRDLIKERQQRVGMLRHVQHREITADKGMYQHQSAETRKREHQHCRAHREPRQRRLVGGARHGRRERLHQRHDEREHGGKMPKLDQVQGKISHMGKRVTRIVARKMPTEWANSFKPNRVRKGTVSRQRRIE